jgi:glucose/arabinose dehydrogenase
MGERYFLRDQAQDISNHNGTVLRIHDNGRVPDDNPFVGLASAMPEIWSYGHRNAQGLAFHPETGDLWLNEHGPQGGDEINIVRPGRNYGWPVITYGMEYDDEGGGPIGEGITEREGMEQPVYYYRPSIGPSDLVFYQGDAFPRWRGDAFIGAMALTHLSRLEVAEDRVLKEERLLEDRDWRVRSIEEGPDGSLYLGIDGGMIVRLRPLEPHD